MQTLFNDVKFVVFNSKCVVISDIQNFITFYTQE